MWQSRDFWTGRLGPGEQLWGSSEAHKPSESPGQPELLQQQ